MATNAKKPKRLAFVLATAALALSSAACGTAPDAPATAQAAQTTQTVQTANVVVPPPAAVAAGDLACATQSPGEVPPLLRCTGLFSDAAAQTIAPENREFAPAVRLWSDGATKRRWIHLPAGAQIDSRDMTEWKFPVGTKLWKDFSFRGKHVETRMFWKTGDATWARTTYRWTGDQTEARRFETGDKAVDVGGPKPYEIPSTDECDACHGGREDKILGFDAVALGLPGATGVTLSELVAEGLLTNPPAQTQLAIPEDSTGKAAAALGYLHANCGTTCHNRNEGAYCHGSGLFMRLTYDELSNPSLGVRDLDAYKTAVGIPAPAAGEGFLRIAPGDVAHSGIVHLMSRRNEGDGSLQMPLLDTHIVDPDGVAAVTAWIAALGAP